ncbi:MAG: hypothetical protein IPM20_07565 [Gammaproteobacteria bacterium]|nr:hypothetical protein [Gammaproteobacteria bacterium]
MKTDELAGARWRNYHLIRDALQGNLPPISRRTWPDASHWPRTRAHPFQSAPPSPPLPPPSEHRTGPGHHGIRPGRLPVRDRGIRGGCHGAEQRSQQSGRR